MSSREAAISKPPVHRRRRPVAAGFLAAMLGAIVLAVVGFAPIEVVHNAAHDTRHAAGFPATDPLRTVVGPDALAAS